MSDPSVAESTEPQANSAPEAKTAREAAQILVARRQELRQASAETPEPAPEPANAEPVESPSVTTEAAEAEAIDFSAFDMAEVAAPIAERDQADQTTDVSPEPVFTLKHDGQEQQVSRQEAIDLAQMGMDYRKKTQDLAEQRRSVESQQSSLQSEIEGLRQDRERLAQHLKTFTTDVQPPDPSLAESDYEAFSEQMAKYQASQLRAEQVAQELDAQQKKDQKARQDQYQRWFGEQMNRLHTRVPDMAKQDVSHAVGRYLTQGMGFHPDELIQGTINPGDARLQEMAYKAMQHDLARAKAGKLRSQPPKTSSGGARSGPNVTGVEKHKAGQRLTAREAANLLRERKGR